MRPVSFTERDENQPRISNEVLFSLDDKSIPPMVSTVLDGVWTGVLMFLYGTTEFESGVHSTLLEAEHE